MEAPSPGPPMHPAKRIHAAKSQKLAGKTIVLCVTGSIAAVETVKLARELIRHGAHVVPVLSRDAMEIIHPNALQFATGRDPITKLDGTVPHIELVGSDGTADLVLIAPATSNTIAKVATGIDDTVVTTFAQNALGAKIPILIAPAMHETMYANPIVASHIRALESHGVAFVTPTFEEEKAKLADLDEIVAHALRLLSGRPLAGKRVVVVAGATVEPIDDVRIVTNRSTGETGLEVAKAAFELGADLELWLGRHHAHVPPYLHPRTFETTADLAAMAATLEADVCVVPAAIGDFAPKAAKGKISSRRGPVKLDLHPTPKVLPALRKGAKVLVGFKAEARIPPAQLRARAMTLLREAKLDFVVANDIAHVRPGETSIVILDRRGRGKKYAGSKAGAAEAIWSAVLHGEGK